LNANVIGHLAWSRFPHIHHVLNVQCMDKLATFLALAFEIGLEWFQFQKQDEI